MTKVQPTTSCLDDRKNCAVFYNSFTSIFSLPLKTTREKEIFFFQIILTAALAEVMDPLGNEIGVDSVMDDDVIDGSCINFSSLNIRTEFDY